MIPYGYWNLFTGSQCMAQGLGVQVTATAKEAPPICQVTPDSLDFGTVALGQSKDLTFRIANVGSGTISGSLFSGGSYFTFVGPTTYSLGAGQAAYFTLRFTPDGAGPRPAGGGWCALGAGSSCPNLKARGTGN